MLGSSSGVAARAGRTLARRARLLLSLLLLGGADWGFLRSLTDSPSPRQLEERLRAEVPVGASQAQIQAWIEQKPVGCDWSRTDWFDLKALAEGAGVPEADVGEAVRVGLPDVAGWDMQLRPYRTNVYILLDHESRLVGYYSHTYAQRPLWHRLVP
jgi:hypothetical protein